MDKFIIVNRSTGHVEVTTETVEAAYNGLSEMLDELPHKKTDSYAIYQLVNDLIVSFLIVAK